MFKISYAEGALKKYENLHHSKISLLRYLHMCKYECMFVVCMSIISPPPPSPQVLNSILSSMDERDVNINDLISNLRKRGNSEKAVR